MRSLLLSLLILAVPATAAAGNYVSVGIGETAASQELALEGQGGKSGRVMIGQRFGLLSAEAGVFSNSLTPETSLVGMAMDLKLHVGLTGPLGVFGKAGLTKAWVRGNGQGTIDSGSGHELGIGAQLGLGAGLAHASLWLEAGRQTLRLEAGEAYIDTAQVGLAVGF